VSRNANDSGSCAPGFFVGFFFGTTEDTERTEGFAVSHIQSFPISRVCTIHPTGVGHRPNLLASSTRPCWNSSMNSVLLGPFGMQELIVILLVTSALVVLYYLPLWIIFRRVGMSSWWALLALVPGGIIAALFILAFAPWKINSEK